MNNESGQGNFGCVFVYLWDHVLNSTNTTFPVRRTTLETVRFSTRQLDDAPSKQKQRQ